MGKQHSKEFKEKALRAYASERTVVDVAKELGINPGLLSRWAQRAGIGRNTVKRRRTVVKRPVVLKRVTKRSVIDGPLRTVASLMTEPGLSDRQRVKMTLAYLNER